MFSAILKVRTLSWYDTPKTALPYVWSPRKNQPTESRDGSKVHDFFGALKHTNWLVVWNMFYFP